MLRFGDLQMDAGNKSPNGDSDFYNAPYLNRDEAKFKLDNDNVRNVNSKYGSGSLLCCLAKKQILFNRI